MKTTVSTTLIALFSVMLACGDPTPSKSFSHPDRIRYDDHCMTIDGKDTFIYSATFHYFRTPKPLWRDRFQKIKAAGFNTVETYVPWNWHEREMPHDINDFSQIDLTDIRDWLDMAHNEFGLYTVVRPGPFICAEWAGGGYPRWLAKFAPTEGGYWLRSGADSHIAWSIHWYHAVCQLFATEQLTRKPKGSKGIIMVQIENEYNHHSDPQKTKVLKALYQSVRNSKVDVPIFTCATNETRGSNDPELSQVFDCDNYYVGLGDAPGCAHRMAGLRKQQPDAPGFVTELQGGWFSLVNGGLSDDHYSDARHFNAISWMSILGGATGLEPYVFVGGTHFDGWGARGMTTTYDYNAAIRESGALGPKYFVAKGIGEFIHDHQSRLLRAEGGPCELQGAPKNVFGGVRVGPDGTRFVFLTNTDAKNPVSGKLTVVPGKINRPSEPIYNINQYGEKVLIKPTESQSGDVSIPAFEVTYNLADLDAKVLVIPPGKSADQGTWYPKPQKTPTQLPTLPASVRITSSLTHDDPLDGKWSAVSDMKSLPEMGVSDHRYVIYRAKTHLTSDDVAKFNHLLINSFSRDIVTVQINGKLPKRLYPSDAYAATINRDSSKSSQRIKDNEFDNQFDLTGMLKEGENEVIFIYENIGHEHGYFPMEEQSGIRKTGFSDNAQTISQPLNLEWLPNLGGITAGWTKPEFNPADWQKINLDTTTPIPTKGNGIQPKTPATALVTWHRLEFELPATKRDQWIPWLLRLNASGNGYMWLNGHNIGRHYEAGPQREFDLPECWLNFGPNKKNTIVLGLRQTIHGATVKSAEIAPYPHGAMTIETKRR